MTDSPVKTLLQDETRKHALIGHLQREVAVMYREALKEIERLEGIVRARPGGTTSTDRSEDHA